MFRAHGLKGLYLGLCRSMRRVPFPVRIRAHGLVGTVPEILNLYDNFVRGELRDDLTESFIRNQASPVIVDCGVNVGVTVRWWLSLNNCSHVYGIDMMQESHAFVKRRLDDRGNGRYTAITAALSDRALQDVRISFSNPLDGTNRIGGLDKPGLTTRNLLTKTLDGVLPHGAIDQIHLLKIDIEGHGALALAGAAVTLQKTEHIVIEIHDEDELTRSEEVLFGAGFRIRRFNSRNAWFKRSKKAP